MGGRKVKKEGSLKLILAVLVIVFVCVVSLGGVYVKDKNISKNALAEYVLGSDLDTKTIIKLDVQKDEENNQSTSNDNQTTESGEQSNVNTEESVSSEENNQEKSEENNSENTENTQENKEENAQENQENKTENTENLYTVENYKKSKKIIENRLRLAGIDQYAVGLDEQSGSIVVELPSDISTYILDGLSATGKVEIKIPETGEVIGNNKSIKNFKVGVDSKYVSSGMGKIITLDIEFNKDIVNKFKEMKNNYTAPVDENGTATEQKIDISIDGNSIYSGEESKFLEAASSGILKLSFGDYTTNEDQVEASLQYSNARKMLVKTENLNLKYNTKYEQAVHSNISEFGIKCVFAVVLGVMLLYLLIKYKARGLLAMLSIIGFQALLLLVIRYTKIQISVASIVTIIGMMILQFIYLIKILSNNKVSSTVFSEKTMDFTMMLIPAFIVSMVLSLIPAMGNLGNTSEISVFGMIVFWGLVLFELFNNILTRAILTNAKNK